LILCTTISTTSCSIPSGDTGLHPVYIRQVVPVYAAPLVRKDEPASIQKNDLPAVVPSQQGKLLVKIPESVTESEPENTPVTPPVKILVKDL